MTRLHATLMTLPALPPHIRTWLAGLILALSGCSGTDPGTSNPTTQPVEERQAQHFMVSAAHPAAVEAGLDMLRRGGHAVDAAIATQMVLGFIEAPETGIGGGGFLLLHDAASGRSMMYDGRETAPQAATEDRFRRLGLPLPKAVAIPSSASVGVPGLVAMLGAAHQEHGRLPWETLFEPAIRLAEQGMDMPPRLQTQVRQDWSLRLFGDTRDYFRRQARQDPPRLRNEELARTMQRIADDGPQSFYQGDIADQFVARVREGRWGPDDLTLEDMAGYRSVLRRPVCGSYRQWTLCGGAPPSSGGLTILQALGMLERFPLGEMSPDDPTTWHLIAEASRLAFADRDYYIGDPDFVEVPVEALLDRDYLAGRSELIDPQQTMDDPSPGEPSRVPVLEQSRWGPDPDGTGTSHFSVVDAEGNMLALTSSNEAPFGSRMLSQGFVVNSQLTDFSFAPTVDGRAHPNAVGPGKRPRSSMSPFVVFDAQGEPRLVIGSRGGSRIIGYVLKTLIGVLDWNLDVQDAIALPNMVERGQGIEIEAGTELEALASQLEALGHQIRIVPMTSGLHGIERIESGWRGGADPRLDGVALGD
ncbi:gamma-glutamyltransferase [Halopseudomonas nanhaiensis]|uniref:gamma-glutamyltransferase n=1 Tax=Halopseudomonas nanhaiensis TaxID=2830842 RepID=UPI001CC1A600|nr:gamma-glutamyltransferase [Halopseudomonas nanhaiensis]UAW98053.1 gamma-glutamyltransferase [Halopseudomonas nanhaiensis]